MQRDIDSLRESFDLLVIGGGIYGAALARLAARSGWRVALVEREDFGGATSRNCAKLVHGGLRYVQHLDLPRLRESVAAQRDWRAAAPHLVRPMRFVIPTHGTGARGPAALAAGILVYELAAIDRNRGVADTVRLPRAGIMGRRALLQRFPMLDGPGVNGGAWWYDAQMLDASRLTLECVVDAVAAGAAAVNHAEAVALIEHRGTVEGAVVRDRIGGRELEVRARLTINATGPWMERLLPRSASRPARPPLFWSRNVNLVTRRLFDGDTAIGVASRRPADAVVGRARRLFFVSPWQDCSVIGTWHDVYTGDPDAVCVTPREIASFVAEVNDALPSAALRAEDVRSVHVGITPGTGDEVEHARRPSIVDHRRNEGIEGLLSLAGIKYTTAPTTAAHVLACVRDRLGPPRHRARFSDPLPGARPVPAEDAGIPRLLDRSEPAVLWTARTYGSNATEALCALPAQGLPAAEHVFRCRVTYGIEHEMVMTLSDALFRATDHAERGLLTEGQLQWCADTLAAAHGWSAARRSAELRDVRARLERMHSRISPEPSGQRARIHTAEELKT
mgnify:FL=1